MSTNEYKRRNGDTAMTERIITTLMDTDLYKLTMMQTVMHRYPDAIVEHRFHCRNTDVDLRPLVPLISEQIDALCEMTFMETELNYLRRRLKFMKRDFIQFLKIFKFDRSQIKIHSTDNGLEITTFGPWWQTILYEIYVLSIVNEIYFREKEKSLTSREKFNIEERGFKLLEEKLALIKDVDGFVFTDFGTRRRFSKDWQYQVVDYCKKVVPDQLFGTSNVNLARELDLTPIGTMAHEYLQAFQAFNFQLVDSQKAALETWVQEYRGDLGVALTDVIGIDAFLKDFDLYFAKLFDGVRHDSGNPFEWGEKVIDHYGKLDIDPSTKLLVFSDGLTVPKALELHNHFKGRIKTSFGIGTNLTNDVGFKPLNIVMKMIKCNGKPVAKISDSPGKGMCEDPVFESYLKKVFEEKHTLFDNPTNDYI